MSSSVANARKHLRPNTAMANPDRRNPWKPVVSRRQKMDAYNRDNGLCGIHIDGCGKHLPPDLFTIDHIVPIFTLKRYKVPPYKHSVLFNLQPMHEKCNTNRHFKRGWIKDTKKLPKFKCKCHRWVVDKQCVYFHGPWDESVKTSSITIPRNSKK